MYIVYINTSFFILIFYLIINEICNLKVDDKKNINIFLSFYLSLYLFSFEKKINIIIMKIIYLILIITLKNKCL